jgi:hypothetical protein
VGNSKFSIDLCKKLYDVMCNFTVFTVTNLPDFIYLILPCYQDWIKMHHVYELFRKITAASILQANIIQNTGHIPPSFVNLFCPPFFTFKLVGMLASSES